MSRERAQEKIDEWFVGAAGGVTNGVRFIWNAAADLPADFKAQGVTIKVSAEK